MRESANTRTLPWFALRVKSHREKKVTAAVRGKGFEAFLPLSRSLHHWSDRSKLIEELPFPGYVFCRVSPEDRFPLLTIPGSMHFVGIDNHPVAIDEQEISAIRDALDANAVATPWPFMERGERVRLTCGPLAGLEGFLINGDNPQRIVVGLTLLKRSIAIEIAPDWIQAATASTDPQSTKVTQY